MNATYVHRILSGTNHRRFRALAFALALLTIIPLAFVGVSSMDTVPSHADIVQYLMCSWDNDDGTSVPVAKSLYELATTDDFQRQVDYKSEDGAEADTVDNVGNLISGKNYDAVQLDILNNANNTTTQYTPYDRFGFAGMNFTDYNGEWNWYKVYYCRANGKGYGDSKDPEDGHLNQYYKQRNGHRPMDTFDGIGSSTDPRVKHKAQSLSDFSNNWNLNIANFLFWITKILTALVSMCMELTLSDMAAKLGVTSFIEGTGGNNGLYGMLFQNLFLQMMALMMVATFLISFLKFVKAGSHSARESIGGILSAFGCMIAGLVMMANPLFFINLPNDIGMIGEGIMLTGISNVTNNNSTEFCNTATNGGRTGININFTGNITRDSRSIGDQLSDSGSASRRTLECEYYVIFALQPYALGQYGANYTDLWANGHALNGGGTLNNTMSADYTGSAPVPLGHNTVIHNWLIYQISAQSNRHIDSSTIDPSTGRMTPPAANEKFTTASQYESQLTQADGTNTDWWRVVDALANYKTDSNGAGSKDPANRPVRYWNTWIGGSNMSRLLIALLSVLFAVVGLAAPILIGLSVVAYGIGSVLVMGFAPIALTLGMWAGFGQTILKGWIQLVGTLVLKRIVMGFVFMLLTVFLINITAGITGMAGWFNAMVLTSIISYALAKNRRYIADMMGRVHLNGAANLNTGASNGAGALRKVGGAATQTGMAGIAGAMAGVRYDLGNGSVVRGATRGSLRAMKTSLEHLSYQTRAGRQYATAKRRMHNDRYGKDQGNIYCDRCGKLIENEQDAVMISDGRYLCDDCATMMHAGNRA